MHNGTCSTGPSLQTVTVVTAVIRGEAETEGLKPGRHYKGASTLVTGLLLEYKTAANRTRCQTSLILGDRYPSTCYVSWCTSILAIGEPKGLCARCFTHGRSGQQSKLCFLMLIQ